MTNELLQSIRTNGLAKPYKRLANPSQKPHNTPFGGYHLHRQARLSPPLGV